MNVSIKIGPFHREASRFVTFAAFDLLLKNKLKMCNAFTVQYSYIEIDSNGILSQLSFSLFAQTSTLIRNIKPEMLELVYP